MILVGGTYEYTAGYVADNLRNYGNSFASTDNTTNNKTESTQYATVYTKVESDSYTENYTANINKVFGDGITETSTAGTGTTSWRLNNSIFVGKYNSDSYPFFGRGGKNSAKGDIVLFSQSSGLATIERGFRACLYVM